MFDFMPTTSWSCPLKPLESLVGEWRLFFDTGGIRSLVIRAAVAGFTAHMTAHNGTALPSVPILQSIKWGTYTELMQGLPIEAILGYEDQDAEPPVHEYRIRARFCNDTAILEAINQNKAGQEEMQWVQRQAIAMRGAHATEVPIVVPGHMMWAAYQMIAFTRAWSAMEVAARLGQPVGNDIVQTLMPGWGEDRRVMRLERFPWRHQLAQLDTQDFQRDNVVLVGSPGSVEAWNSAWNTTPGGGLLMGSCSIPEAEMMAASVGQLLGLARFSRNQCLWLLHKDRVAAPPLPGPPLHGLGSRGVVQLSFKPRGPAGEGIRLGNILFAVAASISLAAEWGFALRLTLSQMWMDYFINPQGILAQFPTSFWCPRVADVDLLYGSAGASHYFPPPKLTPGLRSVLVHGYFQNLHYFNKHLGLVRRLLMPPATMTAASSIWNDFRRQALLGDAGALVAVHVRLGDQSAKAAGPTFFRAGVAAVKRKLGVDSATCVLFTDDIEALQGSFASEICEYHVVFDAGPIRDDLTLMVMASCCSGIVISASTFSFWAALLGDYKAVVAPRTTSPACDGSEGNFTLGAVPGWQQLEVPCRRKSSLYSKLKLEM